VVAPADETEEEFGRFLRNFEVPAGSQDYAWDLVCGVWTRREP